MILTYPAVGSPESTVTLPDPEFGNVDRTDTNAVLRTSRHGEALGADNWPNIITKVIKITAMTKTEKDAFVTFLEAYTGVLITYTDHNGDDFDGYIITPNNEFITTKDNCSYDVSFEFMVEPV